LNLLDIGSGTRPFEDGRGWTHNDSRHLPDIEIVADARKLHFLLEEGTFDELRATHILEHFSHVATVQILRSWKKLLKPGGFLYCEVPNFWWQAHALSSNTPDPQGRHYTHTELVVLTFGEQDHIDNFHKTGFTSQTLQDQLIEAGFRSVVVKDIGMVLCAWGTNSRTENNAKKA
jgi:predicted SAM-dependent methyltransferase